MNLLREEIIERRKDGELLLAMDANGKIGLLGEEISRNGNELLKVMDDTNLIILNCTDKCNGKITRLQNTKKGEEKSAIDFITHEVYKCIQQVDIDEEGLLKVTGINSSDHNTITIHMRIPHIKKPIITKKLVWNIHANDEKWEKFNEQLRRKSGKATEIITNPHEPIDIKYKKYIKVLEDAARSSIGKTTIKGQRKKNISEEVKSLNARKKSLKFDVFLSLVEP